jgi:hypothetical protein
MKCDNETTNQINKGTHTKYTDCTAQQPKKMKSHEDAGTQTQCDCKKKE